MEPYNQPRSHVERNPVILNLRIAIVLVAVASTIALPLLAGCSNAPGTDLLSDNGQPDDIQADVQVFDAHEVAADIISHTDAIEDAVHDINSDVTADTDTAMPWVDPVINEVAPLGAPDDWFEIHNPGPHTIQLGNYRFTDDIAAMVNIANLPEGETIEPGGYYVVRFTSQWPGFRLGSGEQLALIGSVDAVVDSVDWSDGDAPVGKTIGRFPNGTGPFVTLDCPTPGAENLSGTCETPMESDVLFNPLAVSQISITLPQASIDALFADAHTYVPGQVHITAADFDSGTLDVGIRLKGTLGSAQDLNGKAAFKISFDFITPGARLLGMDVININNMVQDCSMIHEHLAYRVFNAFDVPALRTGWAEVTVNGDLFGIYVVLERYDDKFFRRYYDNTTHVYEGAYGTDIRGGDEVEFDVDEGDPNDLSDLINLIDAAVNKDDSTWMQGMTEHADMQEMTRMWAVEHYIGHWDGYAPTINNYYIRSDSDGKFTMHPWGLDQTFDDYMDYHDGYGRVFTRCLTIPECALMYHQNLSALLPVIDSLNLKEVGMQIAEFIRPYAERDPRRVCFDLPENQQRTFNFLDLRRWYATTEIPCLQDPTLDQDDDGWSCQEDCSDGDKSVNPGATDICFDDIDQDCNGIYDDGPGCPAAASR